MTDSSILMSAEAWGAVRSGSARSALLTLLSVCLYPHSEPAPTRSFLYVLDKFGFEVRTSRQAISRASAAGWIEGSRRGREVLWTLAADGTALMDEGSKRLDKFAKRAWKWDGDVVVVAASAPESDRAARHILRTRLEWAGFGRIAPGLWISPHLDAESDAVSIIDQLKLQDCFSFVGRLGQLGTLDALVHQAWDIGSVETKYAEFIHKFEPVRPAPGDETLLSVLALVDEVRRFPIFDPGLPDFLLSPNWIGTQARSLYLERWSEWRPAALKRWREMATAV